MTAHLLAAGYRRIAFIAGPPGNIDADERLAGYRGALGRHGGVREEVIDGDFSEEAGAAAARRLIAEGVPDAVFAGNDMMAIGCLQAFRKAGLAVPGDVAVVGFDDIPVGALPRSAAHHRRRADRRDRPPRGGMLHRNPGDGRSRRKPDLLAAPHHPRLRRGRSSRTTSKRESWK